MTQRPDAGQWLHRTPVRGSVPDDEGDERVVAGFLDDYLRIVERSHEALAVHMAKTHGTEPEVFRKRFAESTDAARAFRPGILYPYHFGDTDPEELVKLLWGEDDIEVRIRDLK